MHLECHKASKSVEGTQQQLMGVSRVFLGWFKVVSKEFKIVYFSCKHPDNKFSKLFSFEEQLKK